MSYQVNPIIRFVLAVAVSTAFLYWATFETIYYYTTDLSPRELMFERWPITVVAILVSWVMLLLWRWFWDSV